MKKKITISALSLALAWGLGFYFVGKYSNVPQGTPSERVLKILNDNGCVMCHSKNAQQPFYADIPLVGSLIKSDIATGLKYWDITPVIDDLKNKKTANSATLAKIEYAIKGGFMPPFRYKIFHWTASLSSEEFSIISDWIAQERKILMKDSGVAQEFQNEPVWAIPTKLSVDMKKARLGSILYHHTALSGDNTVSCATCHPLDKMGVDALQTSTGIRNQKGDINAPTVYNAVFNAKQFWDGRATDLSEQAGGPPLNPIEMDGGSWEKIAERLEKDANFAKQFKAVYPDGFTAKNITESIAEFEKTLTTPNSPFDRYLRGDKNAMTQEQIKGYEIFKKNNCAVCHSGKNLGGQTFEYMGLTGNYFEKRGNVGKINDKGLKSFSGDERDTHKFKTPTLRNVAKTSPYFHDGSSKSLKDAVEIMAKFQRGKDLSNEEIDYILKFLDALTGEPKTEIK